MREKYTNNIAYLHKRITTDNTLDWVQDGTPFYCNREMVKVSRWNPMGATDMGTMVEIVLTTTQLVYEVNDKVTFSPQPLNSIDEADTSVISAVEPRPIMERGNKHRSQAYYDYRITIA